MKIGKTRYQILIGVVIGIGGLLITCNKVFKVWLTASLSGTAQVLSSDTANQSIAVQSIGDLGFSLLDPVSLVDNSTRNIGAQFADEARAMTPEYTSTEVATTLDVMLRVMSWMPVVVLIGALLRRIYNSVISNSSLRVRVLTLAPLAIWTFLFVFVPAYARTPWFIWYVMPLLVCAVASVDDGTSFTKRERQMIVVAVAVNLVSALVTNQLLGDLVIGGLSISPLRQSMVLLTLLLLSAYLISTLFRLAELSHAAN